MLRRGARPVKTARSGIARAEPPDEPEEEDPDADHQRNPVPRHVQNLDQHDAQANERDDQPGHHELATGIIRHVRSSLLGHQDETARRARTVRPPIVAGVGPEEPQTDAAEHPPPLWKGELLEAQGLLRDPPPPGDDDELGAVRDLRAAIEPAILEHEALLPGT